MLLVHYQIEDTGIKHYGKAKPLRRYKYFKIFTSSYTLDNEDAGYIIFDHYRFTAKNRANIEGPKRVDVTLGGH